MIWYSIHVNSQTQRRQILVWDASLNYIKCMVDWLYYISIIDAVD